MKHDLKPAQQKLEEKLYSISEGGETSLTRAEAAIYGTDHSDTAPHDDTGKEAEDER